MTALSRLSPEAVALGRALVSQLKGGRDVDVLTAWMAHDIAAKITAAKAKPDDEEAQRSCASAILELWEHRAVYPHQKRPTESFERILKTIERLDPTARQPFFLREDLDLSGEAGKWVKIALDFDEAARVLIRHILGIAAAKSAPEVLKWSDLAREAGLDGPDLHAVRFVIRGLGGSEPTEREVQHKHVEGLMARLELLRTAADTVGAELRAELERIGSDPEA